MSMTKENTVKSYTTRHKELTCCQWSRCPAPVLSACCQTAPTPASPADWNHPAWISLHSPADHTPGRVQTFTYHYQLSQSECPECPPFSPINHPLDHTFRPKVWLSLWTVPVTILCPPTPHPTTAAGMVGVKHSFIVISFSNTHFLNIQGVADGAEARLFKMITCLTDISNSAPHHGQVGLHVEVMNTKTGVSEILLMVLNILSYTMDLVNFSDLAIDNQASLTGSETEDTRHEYLVRVKEATLFCLHIMHVAVHVHTLHTENRPLTDTLFLG